jgi:squalene-hopene/tetraprenyl-beta-curcumene cyclase
VPSTRANDKNKVIPTSTYWGTAWAVIGLLETQMPPARVSEK